MSTLATLMESRYHRTAQFVLCIQLLWPGTMQLTPFLLISVQDLVEGGSFEKKLEGAAKTS